MKSLASLGVTAGRHMLSMATSTTCALAAGRCRSHSRLRCRSRDNKQSNTRRSTKTNDRDGVARLVAGGARRLHSGDEAVRRERAALTASPLAS